MKPLILIVLWFGKWPAWIELYLETCRTNPEVEWLIITDQAAPENAPPNVRFQRTTLAGFAERVSSTLGVRFAPKRAYKLCDVRPFIGHVLEQEIDGYGHWGYGDIDVVYGDIRRFYTDDLLSRYEMISSHALIFAGHLAVLRNSKRVRRAYRLRPEWKSVLRDEANVGFDEIGFAKVFRPGGSFIRPKILPSLFVEQFSTVDMPGTWLDGKPDHPQLWHWRNGRLTNAADGDREFLYLHFMNWRTNANRQPARGPAPWVGREAGLMGVDWRTAREAGFDISLDGFTSPVN